MPVVDHEACSAACPTAHITAHHLDLEFYDQFFGPGAYLRAHANHIQTWHPHE